MPNIQFSESALKTIEEHATACYPEECCGLLVKGPEKIIAFQGINISPFDKRHHFVLSARSYLKAEEMGRIVGFYHSEHVPIQNNIFSENDIRNQQLHNLISIIYNTKTKQFYSLVENKSLKYLGREFIFGKQDCFSLIRSYFANEFNISITDYSRDSRWILKTPNIWLDNFEKEGFRRVYGSYFFESDVFLVDTYNRKIPTHGMIYLSRGMVLHHPRNKFSTIEPFTKAMRDSTILVVRHESLWKT